MTSSSGLAMSWEEWHRHDAVALADLVRARAVAPKELCAQAAAARSKRLPPMSALLSLPETGLFQPLEHMVAGLLRAELAGEPCGVEKRR